MKKLLNIFAVILLMGAMLPSMSHAAEPDIAPQPCDTEYWRQMSAKAWTSAEQEIMMFKTIVLKGDSVLELVCFDQFLKLNAWEGGNIFTHTDYFGQPIITRDANESLNKSLNTVVYNALLAYIGGSFGHDFLSGRASHMDADSTDHDFQDPTAALSGGYLCRTMKDLYKASMCSNVIDSANFELTDGLFPTKTIKGHNGTPDVSGYDAIAETRKWPNSMSCAPSEAESLDLGNGRTWETQIELARNKDEDGNDLLYPFSEPLAAIYEEVGDKLEPGKCEHAPIKTGITVYVSDTESYDDAVCTNPGCFYKKGSSSGGSGACVSVSAGSGTPPPTISDTTGPF